MTTVAQAMPGFTQFNSFPGLIACVNRIAVHWWVHRCGLHARLGGSALGVRARGDLGQTRPGSQPVGRHRVLPAVR